MISEIAILQFLIHPLKNGDIKQRVGRGEMYFCTHKRASSKITKDMCPASRPLKGQSVKPPSHRNERELPGPPPSPA